MNSDNMIIMFVICVSPVSYTHLDVYKRQASFIKCLDRILRPKDIDFLTVYVDDILIASRTFEDHLERCV